MPPATAWSDRFNKSVIKPNFTEIGWTNLMNECLLETDIYNGKENGSQKYLHLDPNLVMDMRHRMVKEYPKMIPVSQLQIHTEALKLLRQKNRDRLLRLYKEKMVDREVAKLKQSLENHRLLIQKSLEEASNKRINPPTLVKNYTKLWKKLESSDGCCEIDTWLGRSVEMMMETKINDQGTPTDVKVTLKRKDNKNVSLESGFTQTGSEIKGHPLHCHDVEDEDEGKNEIMKRFFEKDVQELKENVTQNKETKAEKIEKKIKQRRMQHAWGAWKVYAEKLKNRKKENSVRKNKIETFLSKLKEKELAGKTRHLKTNLLENREKIREKQNEGLKELMQEVQTSKTEAYQKLREITKPQDNPNPKFLQKMEERRKERLRRKKELEEKKRKIKEEGEKIKKEIEEEKKREEEENKRKRLEEIRQRRRLEKEKKLEEERQRQKLITDTAKATNHYRLYLLSSYGLKPWAKLLQIRDSQEERAVGHFSRRLTQKVFRHWLAEVREQIRLKQKRADDFYDRTLKKNSLLVWMEFYQDKVQQYQVAVDWNEFRVTERAFRKWLEYTQNERMLYLEIREAVRLYYERKLKAKYLRKLQDYPELKKLERAKENRKRMWREKVREIIPDYQPVDVFEDF